MSMNTSMLLPLLLCAPGVQDEAAELWDFAPGTEWIYDVKEGEKKTLKVMTAKEKKDGKLLLENKEYADGSLGPTKIETLFIVRKDGFIVWGLVQDGKDVELFRVFQVGSSKGDRWKSSFGPGEPRFETENAGEARISVAGKERTATRVTMKITGEKDAAVGTIEFHLVPGIGMARAEFKAGGVPAFVMELREHFPAK